MYNKLRPQYFLNSAIFDDTLIVSVFVRSDQFVDPSLKSEG